MASFWIRSFSWHACACMPDLTGGFVVLRAWVCKPELRSQELSDDWFWGGWGVVMTQLLTHVHLCYEGLADGVRVAAPTPAARAMPSSAAQHMSLAYMHATLSHCIFLSLPMQLTIFKKISTMLPYCGDSPRSIYQDVVLQTEAAHMPLSLVWVHLPCLAHAAELLQRLGADQGLPT